MSTTTTTAAAKRLTDYANCAGCAGKIPPSGIAEELRDWARAPRHPNVLVGTETMDDAGVYRIAENLALVQTLDFFPPLVDDPFTFGRIAAANALSDVYAMNGTPITALNIAAFPIDEAPLEILSEILRGAADRVAEAGAVTLGGHTIRDKEIKFGLSVTGLIDPAELLTNAGARAGDRLVLTKPLGTGFVTTAAKRQECPDEVLARAVAQMTTLNAAARDALRAAGGAHALTDVTGYGLAGHALEMADGAGLTIELDSRSLPVIDGALPLAVARYRTRASATNREHLDGRLHVAESADPTQVEFAFDPQTSGGLLIAVDPGRCDALVGELLARGTHAAAVVGRVAERRGAIAVAID
jgi:selenide,water dikinase